MTREFFNKQYAALVAVYPTAQKLPDEAQDVYFDLLQGIPEAEFVRGIKSCLANCRFFPTIAEIGDAALPPKQEMSNKQVWTKNGWDKPMLRIGWDVQVERMNEREALPDGVKSLVRGLSDVKKV